MLWAFLRQAAVSPSRRRALRFVTAAHLAVVAAGAWTVSSHVAPNAALLGHLLVVAGIVEGAILIGWRLAQMPKSQSLEFLFVSSLRPQSVFLAEALVGLGRLALVTLSGLPVLALLSALGGVLPEDLVPLVVMPFTWGAVAGLGLTVWAYEPRRIRAWAERGMLGLVIVYLVVGVLAGEHLREWLRWVSPDLERAMSMGVTSFHRLNPFAIMERWLENEPADVLMPTLAVELAALAIVLVLVMRASRRLLPHFHERHYDPAEERNRARGTIGEQPLTWWAVRRVTQYSGRINLWLAGGFSLLYAVYTVAGTSWPNWLGRDVFALVDGIGGIPVWTTALLVLAAVPAAFQYGLWDAGAHERCRRLELLLLTELEGADFWKAALAAAWCRGRGYFAAAVVLWIAALVAERSTLLQFAAALSAGTLLWALYFVVGFHAFARGAQANGMGMLLTLGLPAVVVVWPRAEWTELLALVPPGNVYLAAGGCELIAWALGAALTASLTLCLARRSLAQCQQQLRQWYEQHHGRAVID